jgi:hypothetical protein
MTKESFSKDVHENYTKHRVLTNTDLRLALKEFKLAKIVSDAVSSKD